MEFYKRLETLNSAQRAAVDCTEGPVMVVAGPGTGKTELLSMRVARILEHGHVLPSNILCMTFTDSAAKNMRERLAGLIGPDGYKVVIRTFHSFGVDVINEFGDLFYNGAPREPLDDVTQGALMSELFQALPYRHALGTATPQGGWVYLRDVRQRIGDLKKQGVTPAQYKRILEVNDQYLEAAERVIQQWWPAQGKITKAILPMIASLYEALDAIPSEQVLPYVRTYKEQLLEDLAEAVHAEKTKPFTNWKETYLEKNRENMFVLKDRIRSAKHHGVALLYQHYQEQLQARGLYDYDDMLLEVMVALETQDELRYTLQERYQYIMVDEFQDTSGVQMRLLDGLMNMEVTEGNPNIMVVGDDDQAIYKFQGANLSNIMGFQGKFASPTFITLTENYRSTQNILDSAREVVLQGEERLETSMEGISKVLQASHPQRQTPGYIEAKRFPTVVHEMEYLGRTMQALHAEGMAYSDMAIITRKHKALVDAAHMLQHMGIPVIYEKKNNILHGQEIQELVQLLRWCTGGVLEGRDTHAELFPQIMGYAWWGVDTIQLWQLGVQAHREKKTWMEVVMSQEEGTISTIGRFLLELARRAVHEPVTRVLDYCMGNIPLTWEGGEYTSPFLQYYFAPERKETAPGEYLELLSHLQTLLEAVRGMKGEGIVLVKDMLAYVDTCEEHEIGIMDGGLFQNSVDGVHLMTAHKAKGLEFPAVFVAHCTKQQWCTLGGSTKVGFPKNLPWTPAQDNEDDHMRLLYVALTRAESRLYLTGHSYKMDGKTTEPVPLLRDWEWEEVGTPEEAHTTAMQAQWSATLLERWIPLQQEAPWTPALEDFLRPLLEGYVLSVTHLQDFLDLVYNGPATFVERHVLRFPRGKSLSGSFGTAMHAAIHYWYTEGKRLGSIPSVDTLHQGLESALEREDITPTEQGELLEAGKQILEIYYQERQGSMDLEDLLERNFRDQHVVIGGVPIKGIIDRMHIDKERREIVVTDFKTGKALPQWSTTKVKSWRYELQLVFYKLLVEHAPTYNSYRVREGLIEFVEPVNGRIITLSKTITDEEVQSVQAIMRAVYQRIRTMNFTVPAPIDSTKGYSIKDIKAFTEVLEAEGRELLG